MIPLYLRKKLADVNLSESDIVALGPFKTFGILKTRYPSLTFNTLQILYCCFQKKNDENSKDLQYSLDKLIAEYNKLPPVYEQIPELILSNFMNIAYEQAKMAEYEQEIPVGCIIVKDNEIIASAYNKTKKNCDIMAHAEILAIKLAIAQLSYHRLNECDMYVTLEPCVMCAGAIIESRIKRLIFGCYRSDYMGAVSRNIFSEKKFNPHCEVIYLDNEKCKMILLDTFYQLRNKL